MEFHIILYIVEYKLGRHKMHGLQLIFSPVCAGKKKEKEISIFHPFLINAVCYVHL
jgi:hypothetical protein